MSRYINADAFDERVRISVGLVEEELTEDYKDGVRCTLELLKTQPTADVVEVVHCRDCRHHYESRTTMYGEVYHVCQINKLVFRPYADFYCAYGER